jgi:hypothetical protein
MPIIGYSELGYFLFPVCRCSREPAFERGPIQEVSEPGRGGAVYGVR